MLSMRGALAAVMLALVVAPAAMAEKPDETIAKDFAAFDKALEGLDPAVREKIDTATLQLLLDTLKLATKAKANTTAAAATVAGSLTSSKNATVPAATTTGKKTASTVTESTTTEDEPEDEPAEVTDEAEEVEEESEAEEIEEEEPEESAEEEEEPEEEPEDKPVRKATARSGAWAQGSTIAKWQQCGGKGGECSKLGACEDKEFTSKCESGTTCKRHSEWYYQCMPSSDSGNSGNSGQESNTNTKPSTTQLNKWSQCGGKGGNCKEFSCVDAQYPNAACPEGNRCVRMNEWYHQCL